MRTVVSTGNYASNSVLTEPLSTIVDLDLWAYLNNVNPTRNLITDRNLDIVGTIPESYTYHTITPGVNYYTLENFIDCPTQTFMFVAKFDNTGGNFAPIFTAYPGATGLFIGLGYNYIRVHAAGFGPIANYQFPAIVGNLWGFYTVTLESGSTTPIKVKNWTFDMEASGGTSLASRTTLGGSVTIARETIATTGVFESQVAFVGRARSVLSTEQVLSCRSTVQANIAPLGIVVL